MNPFVDGATTAVAVSLMPALMDVSQISKVQLSTDEGSLSCEFVVNKSNVQPHNILHGGFSCYVAETLASIAANLSVDESKAAVGQSLNASHLRPAAIGEKIYAVASPVHLGRKSHVWMTDLWKAGTDKLVAKISLTLAIIDRKNLP